MRSTKVLLVFCTAVYLFDLGAVLWAYFSPVRIPLLFPVAICLSVLCSLLACLKERSPRFSIRDSTPPLLTALTVISFIFGLFGMFLNAGPDVYQDTDGIYYYKGPKEHRVAMTPEETSRYEKGQESGLMGMTLIFSSFPAAYFAGVLKEEQEE